MPIKLPQKFRIRYVIFAVLAIAVIAYAILLAVKQPWISTFIEEEQELGIDDYYDIPGTDVSYRWGMYGDVVVEQPSREGFSSDAAWEEYINNWHDRSWSGEVPASGRNVYAHYENESFEWVAGELLVIFPYSVSDEDIAIAAEGLGAFLGDISYTEEVADYKTALFCYEDNMDPLLSAAQIGAILHVYDVVTVIPNMVGTLDGVVETNDPQRVLQDYLSLSGFDEAWNEVQVQGEETIAILDSGIDMDHPDLAANIDKAHAYDAINRSALPETFEDLNGHGTVVSGIAAAVADNQEGIVGCSYNATILPIRVADEKGKVDVLTVGEALGHLFDLEDKPAVVNMSFGHDTGGLEDVLNSTAYLLVCQGRITELSSAPYNIIFVAANGNNGETDNSLKYPAALEDVIAVGAVGSDKLHLSISSANDSIDICAQGSYIFSTADPSSDYGHSEYYSLARTVQNEDGEFVSFSASGTSFAAPQVSAAAALVRCQHPDWDSVHVEVQLKFTAEDLGEDGWDNQFGSGLLDAAKAVGYQGSDSSSGQSSPFTGEDSSW